MDWKEFTVLLSGLMPETPLGKIVSIRTEEDKDILKHFTPDQHRIRDEWRAKHSMIEKMSEEEMEESTKKLQEAFARAFG